MSATRMAVLKQASQRTGCHDVEEYMERLDLGLKWCSGCRQWHDSMAFALNAAKWDGLATECREAVKRRPRRYGGPGDTDAQDHTHRAGI